MSIPKVSHFSFVKFSSLVIPVSLFAFLFFLPLTIVQALPTGENVEEGSASFDRPDANTLNITTSDKVVIQWNSFDIAAHETVNFYQPNSMSAALNRITGGNMTMIAGNLNANGMIVLVNPNGITISQSANINVGSLIASSLNITNADFMSDRYRFVKTGDLPPGVIINRGNITVSEEGLVGLFGGTVENDGKIIAQLGTIALASGNETVVTFSSTGLMSLVSVVVNEGVDVEPVSSEPDAAEDIAIVNSGELTANGGKVVLTSKQVNDIFDLLIDQTGVIKANSVIEYSGVVEMVALNGKLRHTGMTLTNGTEANPHAGSISMNAMDIELAGTIQASALEGGTLGNIEITAQNDIRVVGDLMAAAGTMQMAAGNEFLQDAGTSIYMVGGDVAITANGNIYLAHVDAGTGNVDVTSEAGSILETAPGSSLVTGNEVHFSAVSDYQGISTPDTTPIQIDAGLLTVEVGSGGFNVHDITDLVLGSSLISENGSAKLSANGTLTLSAPLTTYGTGGIDLDVYKRQQQQQAAM